MFYNELRSRRSSVPVGRYSTAGISRSAFGTNLDTTVVTRGWTTDAQL